MTPRQRKPIDAPGTAAAEIEMRAARAPRPKGGEPWERGDAAPAMTDMTDLTDMTARSARSARSTSRTQAEAIDHTDRGARDDRTANGNGDGGNHGRGTTAPLDDGEEKAQRISSELASRLGPQRFDMWFGRARLRVEGDRLEVTADSPFVAKVIDNQFGGDLAGVARDALGDGVRIDVLVAPEPGEQAGADDDDAPPGSGGTPTRRARRAEGRPGGGTRRGTGGAASAAAPAHRRAMFRRLDEFVVGESNRLAYSTACRLVDERDAATVSPLFIHGDCGLGKTHLLQGICRRYADATGRAEHVRYVTGEQFTNEYIASIRNNTVETFRRRFRKLDLLAIDDVHFLSDKVRTQSEFLHTLDAIDLGGARVVLASDEHPRLIRKFSRALVSRFLSGMIVQIERPDRDTRIAIVRRRAAARNLRLSEAAVEAVASRCVGSIRELEGAITKLAALDSVLPASASEAAQGEIGLVLVDELFKEHGWHPATPVRIGTVIEVVCRRIGVGRADLMGSSRHRRIVLSRALVAYLGRELTTHSYPEIARALGRSYHSTIHTAEHRLRRQMAGNQTVELAEGEKAMPLKELVDQLGHEITRATR